VRTHKIDVTNLIPVKPYECHITTLECKTTKTKGSRWFIKTVVGNLIELEKYQKRKET